MAAKYWFRKRRGLFTKDVGYGWVPISWQGWLVVIATIGLLVAAPFSFAIMTPKVTFFQAVGFGIVVIAIVSLAAFISYRTTKP